MADEAIHKMETIPPPEGEDDAYSAATKIGPMARGLVEALMAKAQAEENGSLAPPVSATRSMVIPKPAQVPALQRVYDELDDGDAFDPTALFGPASGEALPGGSFPPPQSARSVIDQIGVNRVAARPVRSDADWTKAPTLMAMSVLPLPLAPSLEPAPVARRPSTLALEIAIFAGAFLLVAIPAAFAYLHWFR